MIRVMLVILALSLVACGDDPPSTPPPPVMMSADDFTGWWVITPSTYGGDTEARWGFERRDVPSPEEIGDVPRGTMVTWGGPEPMCYYGYQWYLVDATEHTANVILYFNGGVSGHMLLARPGVDELIIDFTSIDGGGETVRVQFQRSTHPCPD